MKNKINSFLSYFFEKCSISIISIEYNEIINAKHFLSYLKRQCTVVNEDKAQKIKNILVNHKDQNVFISVPINEWILEIDYDVGDGDEEKNWMIKAKYWNTLIRNIREIAVKNNLSVILVNIPYITANGISGIRTGVSYGSDYIVSFKCDQFQIQKCRFGLTSQSGNDVIKLEDMKMIINKELRSNKLKRILK